MKIRTVVAGTDFSEPFVKTTHYVATTAASVGVAILVRTLVIDLWASLALHLPF